VLLRLRHVVGEASKQARRESVERMPVENLVNVDCLSEGKQQQRRQGGQHASGSSLQAEDGGEEREERVGEARRLGREELEAG